MALNRKLDEDDIAILEIFEDQIWLGELLRSTNDGEIDATLHPPTKWRYRDYQRQFLSDKAEFILYTGGRAIGKCQPAPARILTPDGYRTIGEMYKERASVVYSLTPDMQLEQRRAIISFDANCEVYTVTTETGHKITATENHPLLTPDGYKLLRDLSDQDYVAVTTFLPYDSHHSALQWHELRYLGYVFLSKPPMFPSGKIQPRTKRIAAELEEISDRFHTIWHKDKNTGTYSLHRPKGPFKHPVGSLYHELRLYHAMHQYGTKKVPAMIKKECLQNIKVFLEALFAQFAELSATKITLQLQHIDLSQDLQELLLRFGIETKISGQYILETLNERAAYRFWKVFDLPGIAIEQLRLPPATEDATEFMRFDRITNIIKTGDKTPTYAMYVYGTNNYISDNVLVHNTVILEDRFVYDVVNQDIQFPVTKESVLVTPNQAQMTPLINKLIMRFTSGRILKDFLRNQINRSEGTMRFTLYQRPLVFNFRIAGSRGENNMIGLHIPRMTGDEMQVFPQGAFTQLGPAYNSWEIQRQQVYAGVPNGLRNSVLYMLDHTPKYKKYHIPAHNNPFYTYEDDQDNIRKYGGEQDDRYVQLVTGRHGQAAFQVIPRDSMIVETYPFYNLRYNSSHILKGIKFQDHLDRPRLPATIEYLMLAIDTGFVDPTVIHVMGRDNKGAWRTYIRYRLTRIDFNEQQNIIDWLASYYNVSKIAIDIGSGGNGASMMHNLMHGEQYRGKKYDKRCVGIQFSENVISGYDPEGEELVQDGKAYAANELSILVQEGRLIFSELDHEGMNELERVAKQKGLSGKDRYFVLSEKGTTKDDEDHILAAYLVFVLAVRQDVLNPTLKKLGGATGLYLTVDN